MQSTPKRLPCCPSRRGSALDSTAIVLLSTSEIPVPVQLPQGRETSSRARRQPAIKLPRLSGGVVSNNLGGEGLLWGVSQKRNSTHHIRCYSICRRQISPQSVPKCSA